MPELPEVQTFVNHLQNQIIGHQIIAVQVFLTKLLKNTDSKTFSNTLLHQSFSNIGRIGKYLIFHLTNDQVVVLHLRMEGKLFYQKIDQPYDHHHVLFKVTFNNGYELRYHDTRRFGTVHLYDRDHYLTSREIVKIGIDPIQDHFNTKLVKLALQSHPNQMLKTSMLDQTKIAGIGNIYADEICFAAQLHPKTRIKDLDHADFVTLTRVIKKILQTAIKYHGTTILSFRYQEHQLGSYQSQLMVHTLKDQPCKKCGTKIIKIKVNSRGTYLCPFCQKLKTTNLISH